MSGILQHNCCFYRFQISQGQKRPTSIMLRFYFKSDFNGGFFFWFLLTFPAGICNKSWLWDKSGQRGPRGTNTENDNFLNLSLICVMFYSFNSCLECGNIIVGYFTGLNANIKPYVNWIKYVLWKSRLHWTLWRCTT